MEYLTIIIINITKDLLRYSASSKNLLCSTIATQQIFSHFVESDVEQFLLQG
jgi:hypothetical protein